MLPLSALAANEVGKLSGNGSGLEWSVTRTDHESITLSIQGPDGTMFVKEFNGGQPVRLTPADVKKAGLSPEGVYSYELRVTPRVSGAVKAALKAARASGDDAKAAEILKANGLDKATVQVGSFAMNASGDFFNPDAKENTAHDSAAAPARGSVSSSATSGRAPGEVSTDDQVIPDDLIVQGSACVGLDCVNNESFGFDTIRLKENNLRIHFDDTSTSAGFPANDWRIVANDSGSGGSSFLAFEDSTVSRNTFVVEAGAPANGLTLDSNGNVGISQSNPALDIHITTGDTPAIRQEQTNSSGFTAQTWDIGANEANWFVRDVTGGSRLPLRIRPGATTSAVDIGSTGNVGINNGSPSIYNLDIIQTTTNNGGLRVFASTTNNKPGIEFLASTTADNRILSFDRQTNGYKNLQIEYGTGGVAMSMLASGNIGINTPAPSSRLHVTGDVRVTSGSFIDDGVTIIAPDYVFEADYNLMPLDQVAAFIKENKHLPNIPSASDFKAKGINLSKLGYGLLEKVEELTLHTIDQHTEINDLKAQNEALTKRLEALEKALAAKNQ